jgi:cytochrome c biogenesis protein
MQASRSRHAVELLSSMRFAISLLSIVAIASVIGTVLKQNEPYNNYLNQFGRFWFAFFDAISLYSVYNAWWFLAILAFLVISTSLCIYRNTPKMLADMRRYKEHLREQAFVAFPHRAELQAGPGGTERAVAYLHQAGYKTKAVPSGTGTLVAAKRGSINRLGYIFAHVGIVVICIGGLLDGDLLLRAQLFFGGKEIVRGNPLLSEIKDSGRLSAGNMSFRGNMLVPEGGTREAAILTHGDGILLQELPFTVQLKKFIIEHYSTGQPKLFASDVVVTDKDTGAVTEARIEVNKPLIHRGVALYQSSFDDGGSRLKLTGFPLVGARDYSFTIQGEVGNSTALGTDAAGQDKSLTLEFTAFRAFNVERVTDSKGAEAAAAKSLTDRMKEHLGPGAAPGREKELRNVGPSFQYKLRDAAGQAREYSNYMLPVDIEGKWYLLSGMRENPGDQFRFIRFPMDANGGLADFMRLRAAVFDPEVRREAGKRFAAQMGAQVSDPALRSQLAESAERALERFSQQGFQSVAEFIEKSVPQGQRERAADMFLSLLNGAAWEAWQVGREKAGLPRLEADASTGRFVQDSLNAVSDSFFYGAPVYLHLNAFEQVQASVFQLTRSPGKNIVYLGSLLLVLGIFTMLYIRERRMWLLIKEDGRALLALSSQRRGMGLDDEFERHRAALASALAAQP